MKFVSRENLYQGKKFRILVNFVSVLGIAIEIEFWDDHLVHVLLP